MMTREGAVFNATVNLQLAVLPQGSGAVNNGVANVNRGINVRKSQLA